MRVITYSRVSTDHRDQNPEVQRDELRRYCKARSWEIVSEIVDHGYSGGTDKRPGLQQLLGMVKRREVDAVVVVKMDRLFRSLRNLVTTLDEWEALGVKFVATMDQVDMSTPAGRLMAQILGSLSEFERSLIRERVMLGLAHARSKGKHLGRPTLHDPESIRQLRSQGLSYRQIQRTLQVPMGSIARALEGARKAPSKMKADDLEISNA